MKLRNSKLYRRGGFSVVELVVASAIFMVVTTVVVANYPRANSRLSLNMLAQDIAIVIREAQVYGTSIINSDDGSVAGSYGVYINGHEYQPVSPDLPYAKRVVLFKENEVVTTPSNNELDNTDCMGSITTDTCVQQLNIKSRNKILFLCKDGFDEANYTCNPGGDLRVTNIVFKRPNPDAIFTTYKTPPTSAAETDASKVVIIVQSEDDATAKRAIIVAKSGYIQVK